MNKKRKNRSGLANHELKLFKIIYWKLCSFLVWQTERIAKGTSTTTTTEDLEKTPNRLRETVGSKTPECNALLV